MAKRPDEKRVQAAITALDGVRREWLRRPGVTAVDVGFKVTSTGLTDTLALRAHVERKRAAADLEKSEVFNTPSTPKKVGGFPVDVIEATYGPSTVGADPVVLEDVGAEGVNRRARTRPVLAGISTGNPRVTAGTIGAIVYDRVTCRAMILSNFHVLAGALTAAAGEPILQPGVADGGVAADRVATLRRFRIDTSMDAAVATLDAGVGFDREVLGLGTITGTAAPALGMNVVKSGRTTGLTAGIIDGVSLTVNINYGAGVGVVTLTDQLHIVPRPPWPTVDYEVSMGGDSGSVWMEESTNRAVGLHFAGETNPVPSAENAICTPIGRVVAEFNISFLPVLCRPRPFEDICLRFPALCRFLARRRPVFPPPWRTPWPPWPPFPPLDGPGPGPRPGPDPGPFVRLPQTGGCGCGGAGESGSGELDEQALAELAQLMAELGGGNPTA